jgi:ribonuclease J
MDNNDNNKSPNKDGVTDFAAMTNVVQNRGKQIRDNVQQALGELREQVTRRNNVRPAGRPRQAPPRPQGERFDARPDVRNDARPAFRNDNRGGSEPRNDRRPQGADPRRNNDRFRRDRPDNRGFGGRDARPIMAPQPTGNILREWINHKTPLAPNALKGAPEGKLRLVSIGGIGDVNKNMYIYEYGQDIVIIDCGIGFADEGMLGVDFLIPDVTYLDDKFDRVKAILHTHGHDDHIGALPYIWPKIKCPIYATKITAGFIKLKMAEHSLPIDQIIELDPDQSLTLGSFKFQFFRLSHSVPDTIGFVIDTPVGRIIHSADFKFDWTPVLGVPTDVQRIAQFGAEGVLMLLTDSLGAEKPGYTLSERVIESQFHTVAEKTKGKMMITTTSSNISRIQLALDVAAKFGRKVAVSGRSMDQNIGVARNLGYLKFADENYVDLEQIEKYDDSELLLIVAGSQGQAEAALARVSNDEHKHIKLRPGDSIIFSTDPIPGNENQTNRLIDQLISRGAEVYYSNIFSNIHVSGHAAQEELKLMLGLVKPKYILPIGGTERSTKKYADLAVSMGYQYEHVLLVHNGDVIEMGADKGVTTPRITGQIETKDVMVDGLGVGDLSEIVIRDRQVMAEEGMLVVIVPVNRETGHVESGVEIVSRGFVYMKESNELIASIAKLVEDILDEQKGQEYDWNNLRKKIEDRASKFIYKEIKRKPMVLPVVFEV